MNITVRGTIPGNDFDASPFIIVSQEEDIFTSSDVYEYRRSMTVSIDGAHASSPFSTKDAPALLRWKLMPTSILLARNIGCKASGCQIVACMQACLLAAAWQLRCTECMSDGSSMQMCMALTKSMGARACTQ
jgi:hypothetical protein